MNFLWFILGFITCSILVFSLVFILALKKKRKLDELNELMDQYSQFSKAFAFENFIENEVEKND